MSSKRGEVMGGAALALSLIAVGLSATAGAGAATTPTVIPVASTETECATLGTQYCGVVRNGTLTSADVADDSLTSTDLANNSVTSGEVQNRTLQSTDVKSLAWSAPFFHGDWSAAIPTSQSRFLGSVSDPAILPTLTAASRNFDTTSSAQGGTTTQSAGTWDNCRTSSGQICITVPQDGYYIIQLKTAWQGDTSGTVQSQIYFYDRTTGVEITGMRWNAGGSPNSYTDTASLQHTASGVYVQNGTTSARLFKGDQVVLGITQLGALNTLTATVQFDIFQP